MRQSPEEKLRSNLVIYKMTNGQLCGTLANHEPKVTPIKLEYPWVYLLYYPANTANQAVFNHHFALTYLQGLGMNWIEENNISNMLSNRSPHTVLSTGERYNVLRNCNIVHYEEKQAPQLLPNRDTTNDESEDTGCYGAKLFISTVKIPEEHLIGEISFRDPNTCMRIKPTAYANYTSYLNKQNAFSNLMHLYATDPDLSKPLLTSTTEGPTTNTEEPTNKRPKRRRLNPEGNFVAVFSNNNNFEAKQDNSSGKGTKRTHGQ